MSNFPGAVQYPVKYWGYPYDNNPRRIKPTVLLVVHITGNSDLPSAIGEATYSNRDGSSASFTFVTNRDGSLVQCLQPETQVPWTNGDGMSPNMAIPTVAAIFNGNPYNANEFCWMTCENVGYEPANPITAAQKETLARLAAWGSKISGIPISRNTILGHRDINSVTRHGCPTAGDLEIFLNGIIQRALAILQEQTPSNVLEEEPMWVTTVKPANEIVDLPAGTQVYNEPDSTKPAFVSGLTSIHAVLYLPGWWGYVLGTGGTRWVRTTDANGVQLQHKPQAIVDCSAEVSAAVAAAIAPLNVKIAKAKIDLA